MNIDQFHHQLGLEANRLANHVLAYCDVDLSTDLRALLPLVAPLISGHSDLAIGTRLSRSSRVVSDVVMAPPGGPS